MSLHDQTCSHNECSQEETWNTNDMLNRVLVNLSFLLVFTRDIQTAYTANFPDASSVFREK